VRFERYLYRQDSELYVHVQIGLLGLGYIVREYGRMLGRYR
jgi:hypothetical protein